MKKFFIFFFSISICLAQTNKQNEEESNTNGLSTASAILFGAVVAPFSKAYDKLSGEDKKQKDELQRRKELFEPMYKKLIVQLKNSNPKDDAKKVFQDLGEVYIPNSKISSSYAGFKWDEPPIKDYKKNNSLILSHKIIKKLDEALFGIDFEALNEKWYVNLNFDKESRKYKKEFNLTIKHLLETNP